MAINGISDFRREYPEIMRTTRCSIKKVKKKMSYATYRLEQLLEFFDEFNMI